MSHTEKFGQSGKIGRYIAVMLLLCLLPALLRSAVLLPVTVYIEGDILHESEYEVLSEMSDFISCVAVFTALGSLIASLFEKNKKATAATLSIFALCELVTALLGAFWQYRLQTQSALSAGYFALYAISSLLLDALLTLCVIFVALWLRKRAEKKGSLDFAPRGAVFRRDNPANLAGLIASALFFLATVISELTATIPLLLEYGAPINRTELIYLITPYLTAAVYLLLGYAVTSLALMLLVREKKEL